MADANVIPNINSYEEITEFWDTHSLADYWDQTEPVEFELNPNARRRYVVNVDAELLTRIRGLARDEVSAPKV